MSSVSYLAFWMRLEHLPAVPRQPRTRRPRVPRQRTWAEGRWDTFFHPGPSVALPGQRRPDHDVLPGAPASLLT